jgi:hypothetical protein
MCLQFYLTLTKETVYYAYKVDNLKDTEFKILHVVITIWFHSLSAYCVTTRKKTERESVYVRKWM